MSRITTLWGKKLYAAIFTNNLSSSQINAICRAANKDSLDPAIHPEGSPGARKSIDIAMLTEAVQTIEPLCIQTHKASGLHLLHRIAYTPSGRRRRTAWSDQFEERDLVVLSRATDIAFVDIQYVFGQYGRTSTDPVFEVRSPEGKFRYYYRSWQSGSGFEILSR